MWLLFPLSNSFVQCQCSLLKFGCNFLEVGKRSHLVSRIKYVSLAYHVTFLHCHLYLLPDDDGVDRFAPNTQLLQRSATYMSTTPLLNKSILDGCSTVGLDGMDHWKKHPHRRNVTSHHLVSIDRGGKGGYGICP